MKNKTKRVLTSLVSAVMAVSAVTPAHYSVRLLKRRKSLL